MTRVLWLIATAALMALAIGGEPASAANQAPNWTQNQTDYPYGGADCSPCVAWPKNQGGLNWSVSGDRSTYSNWCQCHLDWDNEVNTAMHDLNNLNTSFQTPTFPNQSSSCNICVTIDTTTTNAGSCGTTGYTQLNGNQIAKAAITVYAASNHWVVLWADYYPQNGSWCSLRSTLHHELTHALGEGHSNVAYNLMYTGQNPPGRGGAASTPEYFDSDAEAGFAAIYGVNQTTGTPSCSVSRLFLAHPPACE